MTCEECCIYSGLTDWNKDDYDRPSCPFYKSKTTDLSSFAEDYDVSVNDGEK